MACRLACALNHSNLPHDGAAEQGTEVSRMLHSIPRCRPATPSPVGPLPPQHLHTPQAQRGQRGLQLPHGASLCRFQPSSHCPAPSVRTGGVLELLQCRASVTPDGLLTPFMCKQALFKDSNGRNLLPCSQWCSDPRGGGILERLQLLDTSLSCGSPWRSRQTARISLHFLLVVWTPPERSGALRWRHPSGESADEEARWWPVPFRDVNHQGYGI